MSSFIFSAGLQNRLDRLHGSPVRGKSKGRGGASARITNPVAALASGKSNQKSPSQLSHAARTAHSIKSLSRISNRSPQVVVKITSRVHGAANTVSSFSYISRVSVSEKEDIPLISSDREKPLTSAQEMLELAREWQSHAEAGNARRKGATAIAMVFSMPPGTTAEKVKDAVVELAKEDFANRSWVAALHTDEPHPHVHLVIAAANDDGKRFNPDRAFLQHCRERFAEKLRDRGIKADASRSVARGYPPKKDKLPIHKIRERGKEPHIDQKRVAGLTGASPDLTWPQQPSRISKCTKLQSDTNLVFGAAAGTDEIYVFIG